MSLMVHEEQTIRLNKQAIEELKAENYEKCLSYLRQALMKIQYIQEEPQKSRLLSQTFNSLGTFFKKTKNPQESMKFFYKTLELAENLPEMEKGSIALAHLNLCNLHSQQSEHPTAIKHCLISISLMKKIYKYKPKLSQSLLIAYYNVGNEYKFIGDKLKAENAYRVGLNTCQEVFGKNHDLYSRLTDALNSLLASKNPDHLKKTQKVLQNPVSPIIQLPQLKKKRSNSNDKDYYKNYYKSYWNSPKYEENKNNFQVKFQGQGLKTRKNGYKDFIFEDESFYNSNKAKSTVNWNRNADFNRLRATEKAAAIMIQSWWRGVIARRRFGIFKLKLELKQAELKAKNAIEEYERVKHRINSVKKKHKKHESN